MMGVLLLWAISGNVDPSRCSRAGLAATGVGGDVSCSRPFACVGRRVFSGAFFFFLDRRAERERAETVFGKVKQCQFGRGPPPPSLGKKGGGGRAPKGRVCVCFLLLRRVGRQGERTTRRGALASRGSFLGCWGGGSCCLEWMSRPQYPGSKGTAALRRPRKKKGGAPRRRAGPECREQAGRGGR